MFNVAGVTITNDEIVKALFLPQNNQNVNCLTMRYPHDQPKALFSIYKGQIPCMPIGGWECSRDFVCCYVFIRVFSFTFFPRHINAPRRNTETLSNCHYSFFISHPPSVVSFWAPQFPISFLAPLFFLFRADAAVCVGSLFFCFPCVLRVFGSLGGQVCEGL